MYWSVIDLTPLAILQADCQPGTSGYSMVHTIYRDYNENQENV